MRIKGTVVENPTEGRFYLLRRSPTLRGDDSYHLSETPGRTNQSHEEEHEGWLGTTNDVAWYAEQAIEVKQNPTTGRWSYRLFPAEQLDEEDEAEEITQ
jgi:hypothetical protein